jgi:hypothetical protein
MAGLIRKAKSGEPLDIPAATFNTIADLVNDWQRRQRSVAKGERRPGLPSGVILVRNTSGAPRAQYDVVGLSGALLKPSDDFPLFAERVALFGVTPTFGEHSDRHAILLEPLKMAAFGRARVAGVCLARVLMKDESHTQATIKDQDPTQLQSCAAGGSAQLLWVEPEADRQNPWAWAVVRLGVAGEFLAKITGSSQITVGEEDQPRWRYAWSEVRLDNDTDAAVLVDGGRSGAVDDGYAVNVAELDGTALAAVQNNTIVQMSLCPTLIEGYVWHRYLFNYRSGGETFICLVKSDGGTEGADPADWTYAVYALSDSEYANPLAEHQTPIKRRAAAGPYRKADDGSYGWAWRDGESVALLIAFDEVELTSDCNACS